MTDTEAQRSALSQAATSLFDANTTAQGWKRLRGTHAWGNMRVLFRSAVVEGDPGQLKAMADHYWKSQADAVLPQLEHLYRSARRQVLGEEEADASEH